MDSVILRHLIYLIYEHDSVGRRFGWGVWQFQNMHFPATMTLSCSSFKWLLIYSRYICYLDLLSSFGSP